METGLTTGAAPLVLREGGNLDWYEPLGADPFVIHHLNTTPPAGVGADSVCALGKRPPGRLAHLVGELAETVAGAHRLLEQTAQRFGNQAIPDRLVSLSDPDAWPIRKGMTQQPTQFGYTRWWPRTNRASSSTTAGSSGETRPPHRSWCHQWSVPPR